MWLLKIDLRTSGRAAGVLSHKSAVQSSDGFLELLVVAH